jgi:L-alanine-DL-glutamate epimerase-like enolase superfamily enzyme
LQGIAGAAMITSVGTPQMPQAHLLIDITLWDMAARYANLPLYQLLGGARHKVLSYASTPLLADNNVYIDYVTERQSGDFKAVKVHCWFNSARGLLLCGGRGAFLRLGHDADARC